MHFYTADPHFFHQNILKHCAMMSDNHVGRERQPRWPVAPGGGRA